MVNKRIALFVTLLASLLLMVMPVTAQDEGVERSGIGPVSVTTDGGWVVLEGPSGTIIIAETQSDTSVGGDSVVLQLSLFGVNRVARLEDKSNPAAILGGLMASVSQQVEEMPEIAEFEQENFRFARIDLSNEEVGTYVYTTILSEATFAVVTASSNVGEHLAESEERILAVLDSIELVFETPFPEDAFARYQDLPQSYTSDGLPLLGEPEAPVALWLITSFDCVECRSFQEELFPQLLSRVESGDINILFIPTYGTGDFPNGDSAARAGLCIGAENFWGFHEALFQWQDFGTFAYSYERLQTAAAILDVDSEVFDACYIEDSISLALRIGLDVSEDYLGDTFPPAILINQEVVENDVEAIMAAIDAALAQGN